MEVIQHLAYYIKSSCHIVIQGMVDNKINLIFTYLYTMMSIHLDDALSC